MSREQAMGGSSRRRTESTQASLPPSMGFQPAPAPSQPSHGPHLDAPDQPSDYSGVVSLPSVQQSTGFHPSGSGVIQDTGGIFAPGQGSGAAAWNPPGGGGPAVVDGQVVNIPPTEGTGIEALPGAIIEDIKENLSGIKKPDWLTPSWALNVGIAGAKGIETLLSKMFNPSVEDFNDPVVLAAINRLFDEKKKELSEENFKQFKKDYVKDYKKLMDEAFAGDEAMLAQGLSSEEFFNQQLEEASNLAEMGELGKGVQRINFPKEYYLDDGKRGIMPQTTGELENLAGLDASQYAGTDLAQMIFDARNELDKQTGGQGGGGGAGIMGAVPTPFTDVNNNGILDSLEVAQATTTPAAAATVPAAATTAMATEPIPIDYSQWPQYQGYPTYGPAGGPVPNYVNQGLGVSPQFNYWNQIARTFPGMR